MIDPASLPYRPNVGAALFDRDGRVFVGRRADLARTDPVWQLPQGGIDDGEAPRDAVLRELAEEIGTTKARIVGEHPDWLTYDFPPELLGRVLGGRFRGQRQRWFALRFEGTDDEIRLDGHSEVEFDSWQWVALDRLLALPVGFKAATYRVVQQSFERFATPS